MSKPYYIIGNLVVLRKKNTIYVMSKSEKKPLPVEGIKSLFCIGSVTVKAGALKMLLRRGIPVHFFGHHGDYIGSALPLNKHTSGTALIKQVEHYTNKEKRLEIAHEIVRGIRKTIRWTLRKLGDQRYKEIEPSIKAESIYELLGYESNAWNMLYDSLSRKLEEKGILFIGRSKRPPTDRINAIISYTNSILYATALSEIMHTPLDPRIGFLHETYEKRFALSLDIADLFKPLITPRVVVRAVNRGLKDEWFHKDVGIFLTTTGKRAITAEIEKILTTTVKHPTLRRNISIRYAMRLEAYKLLKHIIGDKKYKAFSPWW